MAIAILANPPKNDTEFLFFSFANAAAHRDIIDSITALAPQAAPLALRALDPIPQHDLKGWLLRHQESHNDMNAVLGLSGADLLEVDFTNKTQVESWIELHFAEHYAAAAALGIS
jgi:hypothetical protein